jgi:FkbM family methyltransferase
MKQQLLNRPDVAQTTLQGPRGTLPFNLFKTELRRNVEPLRNITVLPFGLYSREQTLTLFQGKNDGVESICQSSRTGQESEQIRVVCAPEFLAGHGINNTDILKIDTEGCEAPILRSLKQYLPAVKVLYVEYHSQRDCRMIDEILTDTHILWRGHVTFADRGEFCYLKRELVPNESETHTCELLMDWE